MKFYAPRFCERDESLFWRQDLLRNGLAYKQSAEAVNLKLKPTALNLKQNVRRLHAKFARVPNIYCERVNFLRSVLRRHELGIYTA